jgi:selenocysteine lyase/cysteine desulfurase
MEYWDDCAKSSDEKWGKVFGVVIPKAQKQIAQMLHLKQSEQIVFAPNTHELSTRLLSLFLGKKSLKILTTSSEFHSWKRQLLRLSEISEIKVEFVSTENFLEDKSSFIRNLKSELTKNYDLCFVSQVFFDSGLALTDDDLLDIY